MRSSPVSKISFALCALIVCGVVGLSGCRSYQLGHPAALPFESIFVEPVSNESFAPQAQAIVSANIREAIIRDSRVKLVADQTKADAIVTVTLTEYGRRSATRDPNDTEVALDYDLILASSVSLYDQRDGRYLFRNRRIEERATGFVNNIYTPAGAPDTQSFIQSEYQAIPRIARDLATKISDEILSSW